MTKIAIIVIILTSNDARIKFMTEWNTEPKISEEEKKKNRGKMTRGIFDFVRNEGSWLVLGLGGLAMLFGGVNFGTIAMMAIGVMLVAAARAAPDSNSERQQDSSSERSKSRREPSQERSRVREQGHSSELRVDPIAHHEGTQTELRTAFHARRDDATSRQSSEELTISAPITPPRTRDDPEITLSR